MDLVAFDAHLTTSDLEILVAHSLAGDHVEFPAVPGALNDGPAQHALSQWASGVRAGIVDGVKRSIDVVQGDPDSVDLDGFPGSRGNVLYARDTDESAHLSPIPSSFDLSGLAADERLLDFGGGLWHRSIDRYSCPAEPFLCGQGGSGEDEVVPWK